jgi:WD40 repeat protein
MNPSEFKLNLAVVIGINDYQNGIPALGTARQDAEAIAAILRTQYNFQVHELTESTEITKNKPTVQNLKRWLETDLPEAIKQANPSRLIFYFAGHGIALNGDDGPQGYLIPQNAILGEVSTYIPMQQVEAALTKLSCRHCLIILDCCFAGAFRWSSTRKLVSITETIHKERYDRFIQDPAWQVITSAASDQFALDNLDLKGERRIAKENSPHSPFAAALIDALSGSADAYPPAKNGKSAGDGIITATELYLYLRDAVEIPTDARNQRQTPQIWCLKKHDKGEFIFLPPGHELNLPPAPSLDELEDNNPYRGLKSYETKDSALFFGRTALIDKLCDAVCDRAFTIVLGASGSGKSSLVKAGLIAHLNGSAPSQPSANQRLKPQENPHVCKSQKWQTLTPIRPGESPLNSLNGVLKELGITEQLESKTLSEAIANWTQSHPQTKLLLVIDQLEELITLCRNDEERRQFLDLLADLVQAFPDVVRLVVTLRSDFEPQLRTTPLEPLWQDGRFVVPAMTREELRSVIEEPASAKVVYFESLDNRGYLVDQLIDEVAGMPGALPLLSFALSELYLKLARRYLEAQNTGDTVERAITWGDYDALGGVTKSLTQRADEIYEYLVKFNPVYEKTIRHVMLRMVAVIGGDLASRRVSLSEVEYPTEKKERVKEVIRRFTDARLLVKGQDSAKKPYVEPAHDALVQGWQRLLMWKQAEEESLFLQRRLTPAVEEWSSQQENRFLWNADPRLDLLKQVTKSEDNWLNKVEADFVQRSVQKKRQNSIIRWSIAGSVLLGSMIFGAAVWTQWRNSELNLANSLARSSLSLFAEEKELDAFVEAIRAGKILQKQNATNLDVINTLQTTLYKGSERNRLEGHDSSARHLSISADSKTLASSDGYTIKIWNLETGKEIRTLKGNDWIDSMSISADGKTLVSVSGSIVDKTKTIKLWNLETGKEIRTLVKDGYDNFDVHELKSISTNGKILASRTEKNTIKLWNLETGKEIFILKGYSDVVWSVSISPDGKTLASGSRDNTIKLWNLETGKEIRTWRGHDEGVDSVSISPDGKTLASSGGDNTNKLWNLETGKEIRTWGAHDIGANSVSISPDGKTLVRRHDVGDDSVSISPDGKTLASGSDDNTIKLWNLETGKEIRTWRGHDDGVDSVSISPDGKTLASGGGDNTIKLWYLEKGQTIRTLRGDAYPVDTVSINANGKILASAIGKRIRIWNLETGKEILTLKENDRIGKVSISADGKTLARGGKKNTIEVWNLKTGKAIHTLKGNNLGISEVSISANGKTVASINRDKEITLWNVDTGKKLRTIRGNVSSVYDGVSMSISADGKILATGVGGNTIGEIEVWNLETGQKIHTLRRRGGSSVFSMSISFDGKTLASGHGVMEGDANIIKIWNLETGKEIRTLRGHDGSVLSLSMSADGKILASGSNDKTIKVWNIETGQAIATLKGYDDGVSTVSMSADGKILASGSGMGTIKVWDLDLDSLVQRNCNWVRNYLQYNRNVNDSDRHLCDDVPKVVAK